MYTRTLCTLAFILALSGAAVAAGPPIYVSTLTGEQVLSVDGTTGAITTVFTAASGVSPDDLTVGPDSLIYVCIPGSNRILRFAQDGSNVETVYNKATSTLTNPPSAPEGPRFTFDGSLLFNTKSPHTGIWKVAAVASIPTGGAKPEPVQVLTAADTGSTQGEGLAITPFGDLLIVDRPNNRVLRAPHGTSSTFFPPSVLIQNPPTPAAPVLDSPVGVAVSSLGEIFVANGGALSDIRKFSSSGAPLGVVASFAPDRPLYLEAVTANDLFVGTASSSLLAGRVWKVSAGGGAPVLLATLPKRKGQYPPAEGIGVPATSWTLTKSFTGTKAYNYGAHGCELVAGACTAAITATQKAPKDLQAKLDTNGIVASPLPNLGEEGFEITYTVDASAGCSPTVNGTYGLSLSSVIADADAINPRVVRCEGSGPNNCQLFEVSAYYPLAPILGTPGDPTINIKPNSFSEFFPVSQRLDPNRLATFCGYLQPLNPDGSTKIKAGRNVAVKFQLSTTGCSGGFVPDARALISVARISPDFERMNPNPSGSANDLPLYRFDPNGQLYIYNLQSDLWPLGTYHVTTTFLTSDTTTQSINFQIVP